MPQATPDPKFPTSIWDGTTSTTEETSIEKSPDIEMGNRMRAEIRGMEATLQPYVTDLSVIHAYGNPADVLTVNAAGTGLEWAAGGGGGGGSVIELTNDNAGSLVIGNAVYVKSNGNMDKAQANAAATTELLGLVADTTINTATAGDVQADGFLEATTGQWDAVTGGTGGLTAGAMYYLDPSTAGKFTSTAPSTAGQYVVRVGQAMSTTVMNIRIEAPILL